MDEKTDAVDKKGSAGEADIMEGTGAVEQPDIDEQLEAPKVIEEDKAAERPEDGEEKNEHAQRMSLLVAITSIVILAVLLVSNWISMIAYSERYPWPNGWFNNDILVGYALAGVAVNILLTQRLRNRAEDWGANFSGLYALRLLQAVVYVAIIYRLGRFFLPGGTGILNELGGTTCSNFPECLTLESSLFLIIGLLVGIFVSRIEELVIRLLPMGNWRQRNLVSLEIGERYDEWRKRWDAFVRVHPVDDKTWRYFENLCKKIQRLMDNNANDKAKEVLHELNLSYLRLQNKTLTESVESQKGVVAAQSNIIETDGDEPDSMEARRG